MNTCAVSDSKPPVASELDKMEAALSEVEGLADRLRARLDPILRPGGDEKMMSPAKQGVPCPPTSPLVGTLERIRESHADCTIMILNDILNRLEV